LGRKESGRERSGREVARGKVLKIGREREVRSKIAAHNLMKKINGRKRTRAL
jgi:hypothetical protein